MATRSGKRKRRRTIDEMVYIYPITLTRSGRLTYSSASWQEDQFERMQAALANSHEGVVAEIDSLVESISALVSELPPADLMRRAWWEASLCMIGLTSELEIGMEAAIGLRMIDYIQSVIAGVSRSSIQRSEVTQDDWGRLCQYIERLFQLIVFDYHVSALAKARSEGKGEAPVVEEFKYRAQVFWCMVRGERYHAHQPSYLSDMFLPFSGVFQELFSISAEDFVAEITKIWRSHTFGIAEALDELELFHEDVMKELGIAIEDDSAITSPEEIARVIECRGWSDRKEKLLGRLFGLDLFDVQKLTSLPEALLEEMAWSPGEDKDFFSPGPMSGWPLRVWPIFRRPFLKLDGRYFCFDLGGLFDRLYRVMQRIVTKNGPTYAQRWNSIQKRNSEDLPFKYFRKLLPGAVEYRSICYPGPKLGKAGWCEADGLIAYDDHLFIIEVKAGAFTHTPPAMDFPAYVASLENLVLRPVDQGRRFLDYLREADEVPIYDESHRQVGSICLRDFRHVTICAVTLDPFTELAAQAQHLRGLGIDVGLDPVWVISVDDLRVYSDVFKNPLVFLHYVEQRMMACRSDLLRVDDELDHLGLYLEHNNYSQYAKEVVGDSGARFMAHGYRVKIDRYFSGLLDEGARGARLEQSMHNRLAEIAEVLGGKRQRGVSEVLSCLLDLDGGCRDTIGRYVDEELVRQSSAGVPRPMSVIGESCTPITVYCWTPAIKQIDLGGARNHAMRVTLAHKEARRLLLNLYYSAAGQLKDLGWEWIRVEEIPDEELPRLRAEAEHLLQERVERERARRRKIGRNEKCPCGSGLKYKRCHGQRVN